MVSSKIDGKSYITDKDLAVGGTVNVFGREFFLYDCDLRTK
jgi:hypothetical protein